MKCIKSVLVVTCLLVTAVTYPAFSQGQSDIQVEIEKRFKIYEETIGASDGWTLAKDKKGIKVYHRKVSLTPVKVFKGVAELETNLTSLIAFLMDVHKFPSWIVMCDFVEVLKSTGEDAHKIDEVVYHVYSINKLPWPVKPRDNVVYAIATQDPETLVIKVKAISLPDAIPHKKGLVRCPILMMEWQFKPLANGNTDFSFETIVDAGGLIPKWISNFYSVYVPYMTIQNIRKQMPFEEKYTLQKLKWLKLPPAHMKTKNVVVEERE